MQKSQQRLITLCKLWGTVKLFHPYLAYRPIDWDAALVTAIPTVKSAKDGAAFAEAVATMLAALDDPATQVIAPDTNATSNKMRPFTAELREDGVMLVEVGDSLEVPGAIVEEKLPYAKAIVFDLRQSVLSDKVDWQAYYLNDSLTKWLVTSDITGPDERRRLYNGYPTQIGNHSAYQALFTIQNGPRFAPSDSARRLPAIFIVNRSSPLPQVMLALQDAGLAAIIAEVGWIDDGGVIDKHEIVLEDGFKVEIRLSELYRAGSGTGVHANVTVPTASDDGADVAHDAAIALALNFLPPTPAPERQVPADGFQRDANYAKMTYPQFEYRLLALFRIYNVIEYFFPYKALMEDDWDTVMAAYLPRFEAARDAFEYNLTVAEMLTHVHDSHVTIRSSILQSYFGENAPSVVVRWIENAAVVTTLLDMEAARTVGIAIGDIILAVDGEPVETRMSRIGRYVTASTPQAHRRVVLQRLLCGEGDSVTELLLRGADGQEKTARLPRNQRAASQWNYSRDGDVMRWLTSEIGYADLDRLKQQDVDTMFETFASAKAIIFDMRGYPEGTAWTIAPRLSTRLQPPVARFERPRVSAPLTQNDQITWVPARDVFLQHLPKTDKPRYGGLTVMLIDERTQSQAEHTGLFLYEANGTMFVGSATAGANGDISGFVLPGGIGVSFTGQEVKHVDGRQLQRVGLLPDVEVYPTIQSVRDGRDEVLETALVYVAGVLTATSGG